MLSEKPMMNVFIFRIKVIKNNVRVTRMTSRENNDLKVLRQVSEKFRCVRSDVNSCLDYLTCWKLDWKLYVIGNRSVFVAVD